MNLGRTEIKRLVLIEQKYDKIIELSKWVDECLEMLSIATDGTSLISYLDVVENVDEAYEEFWAYIAEIKS
jgi:hypothetical protein